MSNERLGERLVEILGKRLRGILVKCLARGLVIVWMQPKMNRNVLQE